MLALAAIVMASMPPGAAVELSVYAASSLSDALVAAAPACERATGTRLVFNFAASNLLARQIVAAAKADLFVSADEDWMDHVQDAGLLDVATRRTLVSNRLVVVAPAGSELRIHDPAELAGPGIHRLSLAQPEAVPAGRYAAAWLRSVGIWRQVESRVVPALDVRAALAAVESGAVDAGIVYATDAAIGHGVKVLYEVPPGTGPSITYPVAVIRGRPHTGAARAVLDCLSGPGASRVFERFGFTAPSAGEDRAAP